jgi:hypothetical protein
MIKTREPLTWTQDGHTVELRSRMATARKKPYHQVILDGSLVGSVFADDFVGWDFEPEYARFEQADWRKIGFARRNEAAAALVSHVLALKA